MAIRIFPASATVPPTEAVDMMDIQDMLSPPAEPVDVIDDVTDCDDMPTTPSSSSSASSTSSSSSPASVTADMLKRGWIAPFLLHLHQMLRRESTKIIRWTEDGTAFQILDKDAMTNQILPKYFKNKNFASFQRQLNYFGFRKWSKARAEFATYSREHFTRDNYSAMSLVKRQSKKSRKRKTEDCIDEPAQKRLATPAVWTTGNDRCKPILPRPESSSSLASEPQQIPQDFGSCEAGATSYPVFLPPPVMMSNPFLLPLQPIAFHPSPSPIPVLSSARQVPTGCKLPSLRELPLTGALLSESVIRPRCLA